MRTTMLRPSAAFTRAASSVRIAASRSLIVASAEQSSVATTQRTTSVSTNTGCGTPSASTSTIATPRGSRSPGSRPCGLPGYTTHGPAARTTRRAWMWPSAQ